MNNKDSFEQRMKMFVGKQKSLMKIIDGNIIEINNRVSKIKQLTGLK